MLYGRFAIIAVDSLASCATVCLHLLLNFLMHSVTVTSDLWQVIRLHW